MKSPSLVLLLLLCLGMLSCGDSPPPKDSQAASAEPWNTYLKGTYIGEQDIVSAITGVTYPYHIYLPASYANHPEKNYPILYVLDGQWNFQAYVWAMDIHHREVIVVAVEEGPKGSDRRAIDYRLPGAIQFLDFIKQELMPNIERQYRIDENQRSFQGTSFGGLAATIMMLVDDPFKPLFKNYIADDASYWDKTLEMKTLLEERLAINNSINANLYLTTAFPIGNHFPVMGFLERLEGYAIPDLTISHEWYLTTHEKIVGKSIEDTLTMIYGEIE